MAGKQLRSLMTIIMDVLVVVAVLIVARMVVLFFAQLAGSDIGAGIARLTAPLVLPTGIDPIKTPYGGVFDLSALVTVGAVFAVEWVIGLVRRDA